VRAQELQILHLHRMAAADRPDDARHRIRMPRAVERGARVVDVDPVERGREAVRIALAADLAVAHDVEAGVLLRADGDQRRVVLRLLQVRRRHPPELGRPHARRKAPGELLAVDQPVGLREAADDGGGEEHR
jgi:hypothetical protein